MAGEIACSPEYSTTRLNGMPIQTLAMMTDHSDQFGEVSQFTGPTPNHDSAALTTPESLLSIHDQVEADTISGSSHGTRNNPRSVAESRKFFRKNNASASPMTNWKASETSVNTTVCHSAGPKVASANTFA